MEIELRSPCWIMSSSVTVKCPNCISRLRLVISALREIFLFTIQDVSKRCGPSIVDISFFYITALQISFCFPQKFPCFPHWVAWTHNWILRLSMDKSHKSSLTLISLHYHFCLFSKFWSLRRYRYILFVCHLVEVCHYV